MPVEIGGAVKLEDIPVEARSPRQRGIWVETAEQVARDRKRGMVTMLRVKAENRQKLDMEIKRTRNGLVLPLRNLGLRLDSSIVRESETEAKVYLQTSEIPQARRNGRAR